MRMINKYRKMPSITNNEENPNQTHNKIPPHIHYRSYYQRKTKQKITSVNKDKGKLEPLFTVGRNEKQGCRYEKQYIRSLKKKVKIKQSHHLTFLLLAIYPRVLKVGSGRYICTLMFIASLFIIVKRQKLHSVHRWMNE